MKKIIAMGIIFMFLLVNITVSSALETKTTNQNQLNESINILNSPGLGHINDVAVDSTGDIIATGDLSTIKLDGDDGECIWGNLRRMNLVVFDSSDNIIVGSGQYSIVKYDKDGNELFNRQYQKYTDQYLGGLAVDSSDNIILTGTYGHTGSYPNGTLTIKVDGENGSVLAENVHHKDIIQTQIAIALATVDSENNIILITAVWVSNSNIFLRKCNNNLIEQWNITTDYTNYTFYPTSVATDSQDNIVVCGWRALVGSPAFNFSYFTVKFDKNGTEVWDSPIIYENYDWDDIANGVAVDSQDNIIVAGDTGSHDTGDGYRKWHTIKYDPDGNELWYKEVEYAQCSRHSDGHVAIDSSDNIIVAGSTSGVPGAEDDKYLMVKYNENGDILWTCSFSNSAPLPPEIFGKTKGKVNVEYTYVSSTTDPDGDQVYYWFDWGDGNNSGWIGPYASGEDATATHSWSQKGDYTIKVKAKDEIGFESEWGTLSVTMPLDLQISQSNSQQISQHSSNQLLLKMFQRLGMTIKSTILKNYEVIK